MKSNHRQAGTQAANVMKFPLYPHIGFCRQLAVNVAGIDNAFGLNQHNFEK